VIILGVDPGTLFTGFGVVNYDTKLSYIYSGIIKLSSSEPMPNRLATIYSKLTEIIKEYSPTEFSVETAFLGQNVQSALKIGYARGSAILSAYHNSLNIFEYSPREIKKSIVGKGSATKEQVLFMVKTLLKTDKTFSRLDESDALAVAICHAFRHKSVNIKSSSWKAFLETNPHLIIGG
jgi:crossover junction endodeoxyribonuclease RuvC